MNVFSIIFVAFWPVYCLSQSQAVSLDFRDSHTLENISSLESFNLYQTSKDGEESYYAKNLVISIALPGGQQIVTNTQSIKIQTKSDGTLLYIEIMGPIMPQEEVYEAGKKLYNAFTMPHDRLEKWKAKVDLEGIAIQNVSSAQGKYYPHIFVDIRQSMNRLYPWMISMSLGWIDEDSEKHSEDWGRENNPKSPPGLEIVSLEAPSGKVYDRADAWVDANRRQDELDKKLGQVRGPDGHLISGPENLPKERLKKRLEKPPEGKSEKHETESSSLLQRLWWLVLLLLTFIGTWLFLIRRSSRK